MNVTKDVKFPEVNSDAQVDAFSADDIMMFKAEEEKKEELEDEEEEYESEEEEEAPWEVKGEEIKEERKIVEESR